jgi:hypothetical protein
LDVKNNLVERLERKEIANKIGGQMSDLFNLVEDEIELIE